MSIEGSDYNILNTDKLAALWPFVGIVCEVLILCIVIFVYEKRRVKPDFDTDNQRSDERCVFMSGLSFPIILFFPFLFSILNTDKRNDHAF